MSKKKKSTAIVLYNDAHYLWQILFNVPKQSPLPVIPEDYILTDENTICTYSEVEKDPYKNWTPPAFIINKNNRSTNPKYLKKLK